MLDRVECQLLRLMTEDLGRKNRTENRTEKGLQGQQVGLTRIQTRHRWKNHRDTGTSADHRGNKPGQDNQTGCRPVENHNKSGLRDRH